MGAPAKVPAGVELRGAELQEVGTRNGERGTAMEGPSQRAARGAVSGSEFGLPRFYRFANAKLSVSSSSAMLTDFTTTSAGTASWTGAKLRIAFTPAWTSWSATSCAASAGVTTIAISAASFFKSVAVLRPSRTTKPVQPGPTFAGALS